MEGAAGEVVRSALLEGEVALDDFDDVDACEQILDEGLRDHECADGACGAILMNPSCRVGL